MALVDEKYVSLTTYRKSGEAVATPVWVVGLSDGRLGVWTATDSGKVKRLRNDPRVMVQPSHVRGSLKEGTTAVAGTAELVLSGRMYDEVQGRVDKKYGLPARITRLSGRLMRRLTGGARDSGTMVLVRLDTVDENQPNSD